MLRNLRAEMARHDITNVAISKAIGRSTKSVTNKIYGRYDFTLPEMKTIRDTFFPDCDLEYLSEDDAVPKRVADHANS